MTGTDLFATACPQTVHKLPQHRASGIGGPSRQPPHGSGAKVASTALNSATARFRCGSDQKVRAMVLVRIVASVTCAAHANRLSVASSRVFCQLNGGPSVCRYVFGHTNKLTCVLTLSFFKVCIALNQPNLRRGSWSTRNAEILIEGTRSQR